MVQKRLSIHGQSPLNRFFLSHLTLLFSMQSTFCERRFMIHLKYFLQIYPPKNWWIQIKKYLCTRCSAHSGFHGTYSSFCRWLTLKYWRVKRKKAALHSESRLLIMNTQTYMCVLFVQNVISLQQRHKHL